ncbi:DUF805 domain-containing protein [Macrococcus equipercicus]|uniref:DUF805 domain-containing protein n=1 Tax=Macrococcus equipercicus TaxID=69967 RepID=A0A9Q9F1M1_9STAP|nr:DUF805 domain-containing protein [Macrococcus equipercicus]UTH14218.1 DUF805 domain-containing protein [Macrococcus equipercicus]
MTEVYMAFWKNALNIRDGATRKEFNVPFLLHLVIIWFIMPLLAKLLGISGEAYHTDFYILSTEVKFNGNELTWLLIVILIVPTATLTFRRFQDLKMNGWWSLYIIGFPIIFMSFTLLANTIGQFLPADSLLAEIIITAVVCVPILLLVLLISQLIFYEHKTYPKWRMIDKDNSI